MNLFSENSRFSEVAQANQARGDVKTAKELEAISLLLTMLSATISDSVNRAMVITATIGTILTLRPDLKNREDDVVALLLAIRGDLADGKPKP